MVSFSAGSQALTEGPSAVEGVRRAQSPVRPPLGVALHPAALCNCLRADHGRIACFPAGIATTRLGMRLAHACGNPLLTRCTITPWSQPLELS